MSLTPSRLICNSYYGINQNQEEPHIFDVELSQSISNLKSADLLSASITFFPIEPNFPKYESSLSMTLNGSNTEFSISTNRIYNSPSDLITELNAGLGTGKGSFSFNTSYLRVVYTPPVATDEVEFIVSNNSILRRLGADLPLSTIQHTGTYTFPNPPIIIRTTTMYIASNTLATDCIIGNYRGRQDIIAQIPIPAGSYGTIINYELNNDVEKTSTYNSNFNSIQMSILDDLFQPLPLCSNANINAVFGLEYEASLTMTGRLRV